VIHPVLQAAVGKAVIVTFRGPRPDRVVVDGVTVVSNVVQRAAGILGLATTEPDGAGFVTHLVVESDGGAALIPVGRVIALEPDR
jgi:hypothetical protein